MFVCLILCRGRQFVVAEHRQFHAPFGVREERILRRNRCRVVVVVVPEPRPRAQATVGAAHAQHPGRVPRRPEARVQRVGGRRVADERGRHAAGARRRRHVPGEHAGRGRAARRGHPADIPKALDRETGARLAVVVVFAASSAPPPAQRSLATASTAQPQPGVDRVVSQHRGQVRHRRVPLIVGERVVSAAGAAIAAKTDRKTLRPRCR